MKKLKKIRCTQCKIRKFEYESRFSGRRLCNKCLNKHNDAVLNRYVRSL